MTKSIDCDAVHGVETIGWLALETGTYYVGDRLFRVFTQNMNKPGGEAYTNINFGFTFADVPVVLPQVQTYNNAATNSVRMHNGTVSSINAFIEGEQNNTTFANMGAITLGNGGDTHPELWRWARRRSGQHTRRRHAAYLADHELPACGRRAAHRDSQNPEQQRRRQRARTPHQHFDHKFPAALFREFLQLYEFVRRQPLQ